MLCSSLGILGAGAPTGTLAPRKGWAGDCWPKGRPGEQGCVGFLNPAFTQTALTPEPLAQVHDCSMIA